jgi:phosphatidate cytidylyltransferase
MGRHSAPRRGLFRPSDPEVREDAAPVDGESGRAAEAALVLPEVVLGTSNGRAGGGPDAPSTVSPVAEPVAPAPARVSRPGVAPAAGGVPAPGAPGDIATDPGPTTTGRGSAGPGSAGPAAVTPATAPGGRAGRNLPMAVGVGLGLGALVLVTLFTYRPAFLLVLVAAVCIGVHEMVQAAARGGARAPLFPVLAGGVGMVGLAWFAGPEALLVGLFLTVVALPVWRLADGPAGYQRDVTAGALIAVYVPFLAGFCVLLAVPADGALRVVAFIATVVCSDVGGYVAGVLFGRHPMAPTVSPKKSWEGFGGSLLACAIGGVCFLGFGFGAPWWQGVLYGVAIAFAATLGDLAESMIKRDLHVKDMGTLLPGHGGLMDRLDSLLLAAPVSYLLLTAFAPPG